ncbi:LysR family transcriptional regulator [Agrobacterium vitis]|uniref:HTH-type transcriptional regulator TtuA n=1 Tax=Agrobacterium vitis TaxID=373 RepID=A0AAE4WIE8_AGRVI|nr:LysR family transcriptional regulator [Agrobacterium vitis]MCF1501817.1 LysR family transcriptional regulator [Allorhizobium sp. Av2]MCM2443320.1 LysR family transcriptional regulator [Agrobacterium vitis]MUZ60919.1 LysR family transcriptional regulator [Agrobacterium vitis]MVA69224.1 LysR family transcriptional regulator [Agrobacterium vitis]MVA90236.1 LysR family transcriptional regulator [Agrobacterium vitis]
MEIRQLRCFVAVTQELHFGKAAQKLGVLPASLGREIKGLEASLGVRLLERTTRNVVLTEEGAALLAQAQSLLKQVERIENSFRGRPQKDRTEIKIGAIDSAAAGLVPQLLHQLRSTHPSLTIHLLEDKTVSLLPKLDSGRLDLAFVRPSELIDRRFKVLPLFNETVVVALPVGHRLSERRSIGVAELDGEPLIVPDRKSRPHSHDLTIKLFTDAGMHVRIAQIAEEKQTIINLVAAEIGLAIVPRWTSRLAVSGVKYIPLELHVGSGAGRLPLAAAWLKGTRDPLRELVLDELRENIEIYSANA